MTKIGNNDDPASYASTFVVEIDQEKMHVPSPPHQQTKLCNVMIRVSLN